MNKREKVWFVIMVFIMLMDVVIHFTACDTVFSFHLNYIASIMVAFAIGLWIPDVINMKGLKNGETN